MPTPATPAPRQITRVNDDLFKTIKLSEPEEVSWTSFDGKKIQGWVLHPPDFDKSKQYPFILEIHGGPHSAYGNVFTHEFHWMAAKGYVVLFPNPRGSSNYGQDFGNIIQYHYPGDDYKDLMAGVDEMVKRGYIDHEAHGRHRRQRRRVAHQLDDHADARALPRRCRCDRSPTGPASGTPRTSRSSRRRGSARRRGRIPRTTRRARRSRTSRNVKTPLMLIDGDDDLRTPPADGGEMMFRALKYLKVPTVMVRFPGETHELSRSGKPATASSGCSTSSAGSTSSCRARTICTLEPSRFRGSEVPGFRGSRDGDASRRALDRCPDRRGSRDATVRVCLVG